MSERRNARSRPLSQAAGALPMDLAIGPCIEVWADQGVSYSTQAWMRAWRNWHAAVDLWAAESGWATDTRPARNARNLARTRLPWSRNFLLARGEADLVDFFEGRVARRPMSTPRGDPEGAGG